MYFNPHLQQQHKHLVSGKWSIGHSLRSNYFYTEFSAQRYAFIHFDVFLKRYYVYIPPFSSLGGLVWGSEGSEIGKNGRSSINRDSKLIWKRRNRHKMTKNKKIK